MSLSISVQRVKLHCRVYRIDRVETRIFMTFYINNKKKKQVLVISVGFFHNAEFA